jgi:four helix bundle protein
MNTYRDLDAWKVGLELVADVYLLTKKFPREELYGLTKQIRKASTSILLNIAEGFGRYTYADKANKYTISRGECNEVEACIFIAIRLKFISEQDSQKVLALAIREKKLLSGLISASRARA